MLKRATSALIFGACAGIFVAGATLARSGETMTVVQKDRQFETKEIEISAGDSIHFTNEDEFLHQLYTDSPDFSFDSDPQSPGDALDVTFPAAGAFEVRCGIHPKMVLKVKVD